MLYSLLRSIAVLIFKIFFRIRVSRKENLPKKGGFILASNHTSYLDPIALGVACPRRLNFMAKEELFGNAWSRSFFSSLGVFPIKRNSADLSALKEAMRRIRNGGALVVFPEGSRRFDSVSSGYYPGIGFLAVKLNVPVVPAFIRGTNTALPKGGKFIRYSRISVCFGKEMHIDKKLSYKDIVQQIMTSIRRLEEGI